MEDYCACGNMKLRKFVPACKDCFAIWGDLFKDKAGIYCEISDIDTDTELERTDSAEYFVQLIQARNPGNK